MLGQSIVRRALVRHGGSGLSRKTWSAAPPPDLPTDFSMDILYQAQQFISCARVSFKWCLAGATKGGLGKPSPGRPRDVCQRPPFKDWIPPHSLGWIANRDES